MRSVADPEQREKFKNQAISGLFGALLEGPGVMATQWLQVSKVYMQNSGATRHTTFSALQHLVQAEGPMVAFKGAGYAMKKLVGRGLVMYPVLAAVDDAVPERFRHENPVSSAIGKSLLYAAGAAAIGNPIDVAFASATKGKIPLNAAFKKVYGNKGVAGFYTGSLVDMQKHCLSALFMFGARELKDYYYGDGPLGAVGTATMPVATALAKIAVTQPLDAIKGRMQGQAAEGVRGQLKGGIVKAAGQLLTERGFRGLYAGAVPRIWLSAFGYAISFATLDANKYLKDHKPEEVLNAAKEAVTEFFGRFKGGKQSQWSAEEVLDIADGHYPMQKGWSHYVSKQPSEKSQTHSKA